MRDAVTVPHPMPPELAEAIAGRLRAIGDQNRIMILDLLRGGELSVAEVAARLGTSQQNASKHLAVLAHSGIVGRRKAGTSVLYRVADQGVFDLCEQVCGGLRRQASDLTSLLEAVR